MTDNQRVTQVSDNQQVTNMAIIDLKSKKYIVIGGVIHVSEREVPFDTKYDVISPKTGVQKRFQFKESTGSEFDPKTEWVFKSDDGYEFRVCNDKRMTKWAAENYLNHKLQN